MVDAFEILFEHEEWNDEKEEAYQEMMENEDIEPVPVEGLNYHLSLKDNLFKEYPQHTAWIEKSV